MVAQQVGWFLMFEGRAHALIMREMRLAATYVARISYVAQSEGQTKIRLVVDCLVVLPTT